MQTVWHLISIVGTFDVLYFPFLIIQIMIERSTVVYGNDGWDVVNDYTVNLESVMKRANLIADKHS